MPSSAEYIAIGETTIRLAISMLRNRNGANIGGAGSFWAVVLAGAAMVVLPEALRFSNELRMVIYGVVLVAVMMFMPAGISGWLEERRIKALRKALR